MPYVYNPIVRTFGRVRAGLLEGTDLERRDVRPGTPLEAILPVATRRAAWLRLRERGMDVPSLQLSPRDERLLVVGVFLTTIRCALFLQSWYGLLLVFPVAVIVFKSSRRRAVHFPHFLTNVGELVIYVTRFGDHKESGYRWTHNEISLKVRMIVAESMGLPLDAVRPESTFAELGMD